MRTKRTLRVAKTTVVRDERIQRIATVQDSVARQTTRTKHLVFQTKIITEEVTQ